jgi:hypothetical protein
LFFHFHLVLLPQTSYSFNKQRKKSAAQISSSASVLLPQMLRNKRVRQRVHERIFPDFFAECRLMNCSMSVHGKPGDTFVASSDVREHRVRS